MWLCAPPKIRLHRQSGRISSFFERWVFKNAYAHASKIFQAQGRPRAGMVIHKHGVKFFFIFISRKWTPTNVEFLTCVPHGRETRQCPSPPDKVHTPCVRHPTVSMSVTPFNQSSSPFIPFVSVTPQLEFVFMRRLRISDHWVESDTQDAWHFLVQWSVVTCGYSSCWTVSVVEKRISKC